MSDLNETKSTFETLEVWKKARELRKEISKLTKALPSDERFRLADQMIRASRSVTANIAEGHGRYHFQENIQFCRQARGSLYEVLDHLTVALDENYISEEEFNILKTKIFVVIKILNGYTSYLKKRKGME
ncbi:MAG: four helix bundle protein [Planctomycetes bacterium GWA2_40_7]|nr:MAG: four helix bundle protein [Planctomycetes bacterium GWA2_40_7]